VEDAHAETTAGSRHHWAMIRPLLREKVPLFALTVLSSIVTFAVQQQGGAVSSFETVPLGSRIANAFVSFIVYIAKTIRPNDLAVIYPYPLSLPAWQVLGAVLLLTAVTTTVIWKAGRAPYLATGWLWYAGTLAPVIGLVQVGIQSRADRYTYVPLIGLFIIAAWGVSELSKRWRYRKKILLASSTAVLLGLCIVTWTQVGYWRNSITLFDHALNVTDNNYTAYYNRGTAYWHLGNPQQAIRDFDKVIEFNPNEAEFYNTRGNARAYLGNYRQAIEDYDKAIRINPNVAEAYYYRGYAALRLGNERQSIEDLKTAARSGYKNAQTILQGKGIAW
jgi:protein O-mannosyl-transferase